MSRMVDTIDRLVNREGYTLKGARLALEGGIAGPGSGRGCAAPRVGAGPTSSRNCARSADRLAAALEG